MLTKAPSLPPSLAFSPCHHDRLQIPRYKVTSCEAVAGLRRASHFSLEEAQVTTQRCGSKVKWWVFTGADGVLEETVGPLPLPCA